MNWLVVWRKGWFKVGVFYRFFFVVIVIFVRIRVGEDGKSCLFRERIFKRVEVILGWGVFAIGRSSSKLNVGESFFILG